MTSVELVYIGARMHSGELVHAYVQVTDDALAERAFMYPHPLDDHPVGTHSQYTGTDTRNLHPGPVRTFGRWKDSHACDAWTAQHATEMASHMAWVTNPPKGLEEVLAPLRDAYHDMDEADRPVMLAQVVRAIVERRE